MRSHRRVAIGLVALIVVAIIYGAVSWVFSDKLIGAQFLPPDEQVNFADFALPTPENVTVTNGQTQLAGWYFANSRAAGCADRPAWLHRQQGTDAGARLRSLLRARLRRLRV